MCIEQQVSSRFARIDADDHGGHRLNLVKKFGAHAPLVEKVSNPLRHEGRVSGWVDAVGRDHRFTELDNRFTSAFDLVSDDSGKVRLADFCRHSILPTTPRRESAPTVSPRGP